MKNMLTRSSRLPLLFTLLFILSACTGVEITPDITNPVRTVAVLPVYNATLDAQGAETMRDMISGKLRQYKYIVKSEAEVDESIARVPAEAISDMSQARALGERLGVDGVLYGFLLNYDVVLEGAYKVKRVRAGFVLVDVKSGRPAWSHGAGIKSEYEGAFSGIPQARFGEDPEGMRQFEMISGIEMVKGIVSWRSLTGNKSRGYIGKIVSNDGISSTSWGDELAIESMELINDVAADLPAGPGK